MSQNQPKKERLIGKQNQKKKGEDRRARRSNHDFHLALLCFADQLVREKEKKKQQKNKLIRPQQIQINIKQINQRRFHNQTQPISGHHSVIVTQMSTHIIIT